MPPQTTYSPSASIPQMPSADLKWIERSEIQPQMLKPRCLPLTARVTVRSPRQAQAAVAGVDEATYQQLCVQFHEDAPVWCAPRVPR